MTLKRPKPVAVYTKCGKVSYDETLINQQCGQRINRERCTGITQRIIANHEWDECKACMGEGCAECKGVGWRLVRW